MRLARARLLVAAACWSGPDVGRALPEIAQCRERDGEREKERGRSKVVAGAGSEADGSSTPAADGNVGVLVFTMGTQARVEGET